MSNKEFNRSVCFTFFEDYRKTAIEIENDFGKEAVCDYYNAIIDYALYEIEPELKGVLKYTWHTTKTTIDSSVNRRASGFREDTEATEKILEYKRQNPNATQREIADATNTSVGKVNKALKSLNNTPNPDTNTDTSSSSDSNTYPNSITNTSSNTNTIREREREHAHASPEVADAPNGADAPEDREEDLEHTLEGADAPKKQEKKNLSSKIRTLDDLTDDEKVELLSHYENKTMNYSEMYKHYRLRFGCLNSEVFKNLEEELRIKRNRKEASEREQQAIKSLAAFGLTESEGNELAGYLYDHYEDENTKWEQVIDPYAWMQEYHVPSERSAKELLYFLREHEKARYIYYRKIMCPFSWRLIIGDQYRWENYDEYLLAFIDNPEEIARVVTAYEENKKPKDIDEEEIKAEEEQAAEESYPWLQELTPEEQEMERESVKKWLDKLAELSGRK